MRPAVNPGSARSKTYRPSDGSPRHLRQILCGARFGAAARAVEDDLTSLIASRETAFHARVLRL